MSYSDELERARYDEHRAELLAGLGFALIALVLALAFCTLSVWGGPQ